VDFANRRLPAFGTGTEFADHVRGRRLPAMQQALDTARHERFAELQVLPRVMKPVFHAMTLKERDGRVKLSAK
jgi:hypothetical protein